VTGVRVRCRLVSRAPPPDCSRNRTRGRRDVEMVAGANVAAAAFARRWLVAGLTPGTAYGIAGQRAGPRSPGSRLYRGDDGQSWVRDQCRFALVPSVIQADGGRQRMDDSQSRPRSRRLVLLRQ